MERLTLSDASGLRSVEFAQGWGGAIYKSEPLFCVFDGSLVLIALWTLNLLHPGRLIGFVPFPSRLLFRRRVSLILG
jgi:hypothetical protein